MSVLTRPSQRVTVTAVTEQVRDAATAQVAVTADQDSVTATAATAAE